MAEENSGIEVRAQCASIGQFGFSGVRARIGELGYEQLHVIQPSVDYHESELRPLLSIQRK